MPNDWIIPEWPAPRGVHALQTTRLGGVSTGAYASLNLGDHVGDDPGAVARNRTLLASYLPAMPHWLQQVHGSEVLCLPSPEKVADAAWTQTAGTVCAVMTADCLPILLCDRAGGAVAAVHAGWRGLCTGVIEATVTAMGRPANTLMAWLGPAIGPQAFEVGPEVRAAFVAHDTGAEHAFRPGSGDRWLADIYALARQRLQRIGVADIHGGQYCTVSEADRFFSYRRDACTGRMATLIWIEAPL